MQSLTIVEGSLEQKSVLNCFERALEVYLKSCQYQWQLYLHKHH